MLVFATEISIPPPGASMRGRTQVRQLEGVEAPHDLAVTDVGGGQVNVQVNVP